VPPIVLALARTPLLDRFESFELETLHCGAAPLSVEVAGAPAHGWALTSGTATA